jgi:ABC-type cobalamin/Fe3+-siderophores transport system ATPase subunit
LNQAGKQFPLILLLNRRVIAFGFPEQVLTTANLLAAYGSHIHVVRSGSEELVLADSCCGGGSAPQQLSASTATQPVAQETLAEMRPPR